MGLTTDPTDGCLRIMRADGQQECYLVLSEEERAKGFVRPVRSSYVHRQCGAATTMGLALAETYARDLGGRGAAIRVGRRDRRRELTDAYET